MILMDLVRVIAKEEAKEMAKSRTSPTNDIFDSEEYQTFQRRNPDDTFLTPSGGYYI
jgi:hypothetical protein